MGILGKGLKTPNLKARVKRREVKPGIKRRGGEGRRGL